MPKKAKQTSQRSMVPSSVRPPSLPNTQLRVLRRLRFTAVAAGTSIITFDNLLDTQLVAVTATSGRAVFSNIRVRSVEIWSPPPAAGTAVTCGVIWSAVTGGNFDAESRYITDTSLGVVPAHVRATVPNWQESTMWQVSGTGAEAFTIQYTAGSIIEVTFDAIQCFGTGVPVRTAANALVSATVGAFYFRGLDGLATAGTNFPPVAESGMIN